MRDIGPDNIADWGNIQSWPVLGSRTQVVSQWHCPSPASGVVPNRARSGQKNARVAEDWMPGRTQDQSPNPTPMPDPTLVRATAQHSSTSTLTSVSVNNFDHNRTNTNIQTYVLSWGAYSVQPFLVPLPRSVTQGAAILLRALFPMHVRRLCRSTMSL